MVSTAARYSNITMNVCGMLEITRDGLIPAKASRQGQFALSYTSKILCSIKVYLWRFSCCNLDKLIRDSCQLPDPVQRRSRRADLSGISVTEEEGIAKR